MLVVDEGLGKVECFQPHTLPGGRLVISGLVETNSVKMNLSQAHLVKWSLSSDFNT